MTKSLTMNTGWIGMIMGRGFMKSTLIVLLVFLTCGCKLNQSVLNRNKTVFGTYHFVRDSVKSPSPNFFESLELKKDFHFTYRNRNGGFINIELTGKWEVKGQNVLLTSDYSIESEFTKIECPSKIKQGYYFDIKDKNGNNFNYSLKLGDDNLMIDQNSFSRIENILDAEYLQVISSSGLHSAKYNIDSSNQCYRMRFVNKRQFLNEEWQWYGNKLRPRGPNMKLVDYFLFK